MLALLVGACGPATVMPSTEPSRGPVVTAVSSPAPIPTSAPLSLEDVSAMLAGLGVSCGAPAAAKGGLRMTCEYRGDKIGRYGAITTGVDGRVTRLQIDLSTWSFSPRDQFDADGIAYFGPVIATTLEHSGAGGHIGHAAVWRGATLDSGSRRFRPLTIDIDFRETPAFLGKSLDHQRLLRS